MLCVVVVDDSIIFKNNRLPKSNWLIESSINSKEFKKELIRKKLYGSGLWYKLLYWNVIIES